MSKKLENSMKGLLLLRKTVEIALKWLQLPGKRRGYISLKLFLYIDVQCYIC